MKFIANKFMTALELIFCKQESMEKKVITYNSKIY